MIMSTLVLAGRIIGVRLSTSSVYCKVRSSGCTVKMISGVRSKIVCEANLPVCHERRPHRTVTDDGLPQCCQATAGDGCLGRWIGFGESIVFPPSQTACNCEGKRRMEAI